MVSGVHLHGPTDGEGLHSILLCCKCCKHETSWGVLMPLCNLSGPLSLHSTSTAVNKEENMKGKQKGNFWYLNFSAWGLFSPSCRLGA